jgi:PAS domain S-box-containing protein
VSQQDLSRTIRIDLITQIESQAAKGKRVMVVSPSSRQRRSRGEAESGERGRFFSELLQNVYDATLITDLKGSIVDVNIRAIDFLQYDREEICRMSLFDIISGSDPTLIEALFRNLENERFTLIEAYCVRKDDSFFPSEIAVNKIDLGAMHLCFFLRDITLRRQTEEMLRTEHNAIQNADGGIAVANANGALEYANPAAARLWGYDRGESLAGMDVRALFSDSARTEEMIRTVIGEGHAWADEMMACRASGEELAVHVSTVCNRNTEGVVVGFVLSLVDISDRKRAEMATREAERQRVMLESIGAACHHMSQPVTVLLTNMELMQKLNFSGDSMKELAGISREAAATLGGILHRLNAVDKYRTTEYTGEVVPGAEANGGIAGSRIIQL